MMNELVLRSRRALPGGVNSPVRAFGAVPGDPVFIARAKGAHFVSEDEQTYLDMCMSWGPLILGHSDPGVVEAVQKAAVDGLSYGACHRHEVTLAERVLEGFPWAQRVRMVSSGTEAVMTAARLARGATGRPLLVKFDGGYHGHSDGFLVKAGSGLVTQPIANSAGVPAAVAECTRILPFDDLDAAKSLFANQGEQIAAVVLEPVPANNGLLLQRQTFLQGLRDLCNEHGALLIFDEVISGFRLRYGGVDGHYGVQPDLTTLGKVVGGGLPMGMVLGPERIMDLLAPVGPVYQAGTLSGNPLSVAAGLTTLERLRDGQVYDQLETLSHALFDRLDAYQFDALQPVRIGSILWLHASAEAAPRRADLIDPELATRFAPIHEGMRQKGVYLPPSAYEVCFVSAAHTTEDLNRLADALATVCGATKKP